MTCKHCGCEIPAGDVFCTACGKPVEQEPVTVAESPALYSEEERSADGRSILTFSILSLAFANTMFLAFVGIIFAIISKTKLGAYLAKYGETRGPATVGKALGIAGLIYSIVMTVFAVLYFIFYVFYFILMLSYGY